MNGGAQKTVDLFQAAPHVRLHRGRTMVVKIGGEPLARPGGVERFAHQLAVVQALGSRVVVVHGGGPQTDELQRTLGEEPRKVDGRRQTTPTALTALRMATAGVLCGDLVAALSAAGASAVGVSGARLITARRRPPMETSDGVVALGLVGDVQSIDVGPILALLEARQVPVLSPPVSDGQGGFLNVNADLLAAELAGRLGASKLVFATGAPGILGDPEDRGSLLSALSLRELDGLGAEGVLAAGMSVKAASIRAALEAGVERVHIVSGHEPDAILRELYTNHGSGTLVTRETQRAPASAEEPEGAPA
jgi:acetylglutamate kinase